LNVVSDNPKCRAVIGFSGVAGWGCPISLSTLRIRTASLVLMYNALSSATAAEDKTDLMSGAMLRTDPLLLGPCVSDNMKNVVWHVYKLLVS
jgi:hypothetical protein